MLLGAFILGLYEVGGLNGLMNKLADQGNSYQDYVQLIQPANTDTPFPWTGILFGLRFVMANAYMIVNQAIGQCCLTAKNEWHAKANMIWNTIYTSYACITLPVCLSLVNTIYSIQSSAHFRFSLPLISSLIIPYHHFRTERNFK